MSIKSLDAFVASCPGSAMTQRRTDAGGSSLRATGEIYSISKEENERVIITQRSGREEIATCLDLDHDRLSRERKRGGGGQLEGSSAVQSRALVVFRVLVHL